MKDFLVSVIVPNYNHAQYLEQRLDTVFNQTYKNFEVIILDDCSTDNSIEIINRYKDNPHLSKIVVNEKNTGSPFLQWDKGIHYAKGELIWIAESDDYCELNFLESVIAEIKKHDNVVLAYSNCVKVDENNKIVARLKERKNRCFQGVKFLKKRLTRYCAISSASCAVFKKEAAMCITKNYLSFKNTGDYQFWTEIVPLGNVSIVRKNLVYWRQSIFSVTGKHLSKGDTAIEDKRVFDGILENHTLSNVERLLAYIYHHEMYSKCPFESELIRQKVLTQWDISNREILSLTRRVLLWVLPRIENYFGILL